MPRPKGSKFTTCDCGKRVLCIPGKAVTCKNCGKIHSALPPLEEAAAAPEQPAQENG